MGLFDSLALPALIGAREDSGARRSALRDVQPGIYRLLNAGSGKCLSYTTRQAPKSSQTGPTKPSIEGWQCGVPGKDDDLHQLWTIRPKPTLLRQSPAAKPAPAPPPYSVVVESVDFFTTSGAGHAFRLDFDEPPPKIVNPVKPSGLSSIPNALQPPTPLVFKSVPSTTPPTPTPPTPPPPQPSVNSYTRTLIASPIAAATSSFQFLAANSSTQYLIYNASTGQFVGHTPLSTTSSTSGTTSTASVVTEQAPDGTSVQAADLKQYLQDLETWATENRQLVNPKNVVTKVQEELAFWTWEVWQADQGPDQGVFRFIHDQSLLALDIPSARDKTTPSIPPAISTTFNSILKATSAHSTTLTSAINPAIHTQTWSIRPIADPSTTIVAYSITNFDQPDVPLLSSNGNWRLIFVPPLPTPPPPKEAQAPPTATAGHGNPPSTATGDVQPAALAVPAPTPTAPAQFLLLNTGDASLLGLLPAKDGTLTLVEGQMLVFSDEKKRYSELVANMYKDIKTFRDKFGWLIWRAMPDTLPPADGIYAMQTLAAPLYLDMPPLDFSSTTPFSISPAYPFPSAGSTFWSIKSLVSTDKTDNGTIYQTITNFRSNHAADIGGGKFVGRRLGSKGGERWRLVSAQTPMTFDFMDYALTDKGVGVDMANKAAVYGDAKMMKFTWKLELIDFSVPDGPYLLLNLAKNLFLSANTMQAGTESLLLTPTPTIWSIISIPGTSSKRLASTATIVVVAPAADTAQTSTLATGETAAVATDIGLGPEINNNSLDFTRDEVTGWYKITPAGLQTVLAVSESSDEKNKRTVVWTADSRGLRQCWRLVPATITLPMWSIPAWRKPPSTVIQTTPSTNLALMKRTLPKRSLKMATQQTAIADIANLADGVYRLTNLQKKKYLVLGRSEDLDKMLPRPVQMSGDLREASLHQLWYIRRNRDPQLSPQQQSYNITSLDQPLSLKERVARIGQPYQGLNVCTEPEDLNVDAVASTQQWMVWKASNFGWVLQSVGGSGALLDCVDDVKSVNGIRICTTPQLEQNPTTSQVWQLNCVRPELSSGYYRIRNLFTKNFLSSNGSSLVTGDYAVFSKAASDWRVIALPNGVYQIQSLRNLDFLTSSPSSRDVQPTLLLSPRSESTRSHWFIVPSVNQSMNLINTETRGILTVLHTSVASASAQSLLLELGTGRNDDIPLQQFVLERVDDSSPAFFDVSSDQVKLGDYSVVNVATRLELGWFPSDQTTLGTVASSCKKDKGPFIWTILPSGTGYYSLSQSGFPLGISTETLTAVPRASVSGLDTSMWKLIKFDGGNYRIVNKQSGLLLAQNFSGAIVQEVYDGLSAGRNEWQLVPPSNGQNQLAKPADAPALKATSERELNVTNGMYQFGSPSTSNVVSLSARDSFPNMIGPDLNPYSVLSRLQVWLIEQNREGWYSIKSFPFGLSLGTDTSGPTVKLLCALDDTTNKFQWRFLQNTSNGAVRCVCRLRPEFALGLDATGVLGLLLYTGDTTQQWQLSRSSSSSANTKFPGGTYVISSYAPLNISNIVTLYQNISGTFNADNAYVTSLKTIAATANQVSTALTTTYKPPALPTGVDVSVFEEELAAIDYRDALPVATIVEWFYAVLNAASIAQTSPSTTTPVTATAAIDQISDILVAFCKSSFQPPPTPPAVATSAADTAKQINSITLNTQLLTDNTASTVQAELVSAGTIFIQKLQTYIKTLPNQPAATPPPDPNAPPSLTEDLTARTISMSSFVSQNLSQLFLVQPAPAPAPDNTFTISHLSTQDFLLHSKATTPGEFDTVTLSSTSKTLWKIAMQNAGGYAIFDANDPTKALSMRSVGTDVTCMTFIPDGRGGDPALRALQRWQMRRAGYFVQNAGTSNSSMALFNQAANQVQLNPFPALPTDTSAAVYHLSKQSDPGKYRLYNEVSRTALRRGENNTVANATDSSETDSDLWQFAKNNGNLWLQNNDGTDSWLGLSGAGETSLAMTIAGNMETWKGWALQSVSATNRGTLISLPRFILSPASPSADVLTLPSTKSTSAPKAQFLPYSPDNSYARFRAFTYGSCTIYICEADLSVLKPDLSTVSLSAIDASVWFATDPNSNAITSVATGQSAPFQQTISNTGDLPSSLTAVRIQIGPNSDPTQAPQVLSVDSKGNVILEAWDRLSAAQTWSYLDWDKGRYIIHIPTSSFLAFVQGKLALLPPTSPSSYPTSTLFTFSLTTTNVLSAGNNGFFPVFPFNSSSTSMPSLLLTSSTASTGVRFISDSSDFVMTSRQTTMSNFLQTSLPVFVHGKSPASLPTNVSSYVSNSTLLVNSSASPIPAPTPLPPNDTEGLLTYSGPASDGSNAKAYVTARDANDEVYINHTDITISLLYPPSQGSGGGWSSITMRVNNSTLNLVAVLFPGLGWIYNVDLNFTGVTQPDNLNPLTIIRTAPTTTTPTPAQQGSVAGITSQYTKLYVYVEPGSLKPSPRFPRDKATSAKIIDPTNWSLTLDSGATYELLDAPMLADDEGGLGAVTAGEAWTEWGGKWVVNKKGPLLETFSF